MDTPVEAARGHLEAQMSQSVADIEKMTSFPFFHIQADGETMIFQSAEELAPLGAQSFKTEIISSEVIESGEQTAILKLSFQRYDPQGTKTAQAKAIWGATQVSEQSTIHWRQFLGTI